MAKRGCRGIDSLGIPSHRAREDEAPALATKTDRSVGFSDGCCKEPVPQEGLDSLQALAKTCLLCEIGVILSEHQNAKSGAKGHVFFSDSEFCG